MDHVTQEVEKYMQGLLAVDDEPVLLEMEALAKEKDFPIIGRLCGRALEVMARSVGAKRIFEMGSGFGYSAYWFSRAVGSDGEIHLTDTDPENEKLAMEFLSRAGLDAPIRYHVSDAFAALEQTDGEFDIVYCDANKDQYPEAWRVGRERVRVGGLYMCDNMLWSSRVTRPTEEGDDWTAAIKETNEAIAADESFREFILPTRDGVVVAVRTK
jgi:caffeoyl-CoA O-methyltransferase